jgi:hypothetical protein
MVAVWFRSPPFYHGNNSAQAENAGRIIIFLRH